MTLVKLERLGMEDVAGAQWVVPSALSSQDLKNTKIIIDQSLDKPISNDNDPRELLRRKYGENARSGDPGSTGNVNFGSDSEGEDDVPGGFLFPPNLRNKSNALDELKNKRKKKRDQDGEKEPLDDETIEARRQARLENARARQAKIKSDLFIHASDEESGDDEEFFRLEEERRKAQADRVKKALLTGDLGDGPGKKKGGRKRKNDVAGAHSKRQRRPQAEANGGSNEDNDDDILMTGVGDASERDDSPAEDTRFAPVEDDLDFDDDLAFGRDRRRESGSVDQDEMLATKTADTNIAGDDEDEDAVPPASGRRRMRAGFVIESDSE